MTICVKFYQIRTNSNQCLETARSRQRPALAKLGAGGAFAVPEGPTSEIRGGVEPGACGA